MVPFHEKIRVVCGKIFVVTFRRDGEGFSIKVKLDDDGTERDGGSWPSLSEASEFAELLIEELAGSPSTVDPLAEHRRKGGKVVVTRDGQSHKLAIVVGYPPYRWVDTGLRFNTYEEADKVAGIER